MTELKYFGELGYLSIYVLPVYEKFMFANKCIIHTYSDYADILSFYNKKNVEFVRYPFIKGYRCCADSHDSNSQMNLATYLKVNHGLGNTAKIGKLNKKLGNSNIDAKGKILLFPRMRREGDYGSFDKSLYENIIKQFGNKEIILIGSELESFDMKEYGLKHMAINETIEACKTSDLCISPDSGMASLLIAAGVKNLVIIANEEFIKKYNRQFHYCMYEKTTKWFNTKYTIINSTKVLDFLKNIKIV